MSDLAAWLETLGLGQYAAVFAANDVDRDALPFLSDQELKELGLSLGHRKKLLNAVAAATAESKARDVAAAPTPGPEPQAERRQLTVMFCDLVGSTALSARLDPEDLRAVIGAYHRSCAAVIDRTGGFVAKYMGDGVLAYFGYPRADEHDAERAVRAGLALVAAVAGLDTAAGAPLQVRVGIATGLVVVGDLIGEGAAQEQAVVGETPNLAARLQALAEPGTVVIAPSTRHLIGGLFDYEDLGRSRDRQAWPSRSSPRGYARERCREPLRGAALGPRRRSSAATRSWRCCCAAGNRRRAARALSCWFRASPASASRVWRRPSRPARRRAAHPRTLCSARRTIRTCALSDRSPSSNGRPGSARRHGRCAARQAGGGARARRPTISARPRCCSRRAAVASAGERYPPLEPHPAEAKGRDAAGIGGAGRRAGGAAGRC